MRLRKYHGLGNDFLILLDPDGRQPVDGALARAVCDRHRGAGADGLIRVSPGPTMELYNADGSRAETSGNGLRCLARAVVDGGMETGPEFVVTTDAGPRHVSILDDGNIRVDMGIAVLGAPLRIPWEEFDVGWSTLVNVGNPHLVLEVGDPSKADLAHVESLQLMYPGGINVELVTVGPGPGELTMRVWERGVGETLACGSGACAAASAAHAEGVVGNEVIVHQPGGAVVVEISPAEDGRNALALTGPAEYVCDVEFPWR